MDGLLPNPGDLIEISRGAFQHWAVYIRDGYVVHLVPPSGISCSSSSGSGINSVVAAIPGWATVKMERMDDVVGQDQWRIRNSLDKKYEARSTDVIVREAESQVRKTLPYSPGGHNCEHFATNLRYGKPKSRQVVRWLKKAAYVATGVAGGAIAAVVGAPVIIAAAAGATAAGLAKLAFG